MPEGTTATPTTEASPGQTPGVDPAGTQPAPAAPEPAPAQPIQPLEQGQPQQPAQPASPPDLGDALQQMNQNLQELRERVIGEEPQPDYLAALLGDEPADDPQPDPQGLYAQPAPQPQQQQQAYQDPQQAQDAAFQERLNNYINERVEAALEPTLQAQQLAQDRRDIQALGTKYPRMQDPQVAHAVGQRLEQLAARYDNQAMRTDPLLAEREYLAWEAQQAGVQPPAPQLSPGAEVPGQPNPAEAGGQPVPGVPVETGAGPGVPQPQMDPAQQAYIDALTGGNQPPPSDIIG